MLARMRFRPAVLVIIAAVTACAPAPPRSFVWPAAEGWRHETIPFPLEFAKDLPFTGVEELRFAPGMFKPEEAGFWSYAFVWWLDGRPEVGTKELESSLKRYFEGLVTEVAKDKGYPIDPARFAASIQGSPGHPIKAGPVTDPIWETLHRRRDEFLCHGAETVRLIP